MKHVLICLLLFFGLYPRAAFASTSRLAPHNKPFLSPDGRFVARLVSVPISTVYPKQSFSDPNSSLDCFSITDRQTKNTVVLDQSLAVLSVRWVDDSKTLVVVEVIAHGSKCELYHFTGEGWIRTEYPPPYEGTAIYKVIRQTITATGVTLTYAVLPKSSDKPYEITFKVNPFTSTATKMLSRRTIRLRQWEQLAAH